MNRQPRWLAATLIVVIAACVLTIEAWLWGNLPLDKLITFALLVFSGFSVLLGSYLLSAYRETVKRWWYGIRQALRLMPSKVSTVALMLLVFLFALMWIRSHWVLDHLTVPVSDTKYLSFVSRLGVISVGLRLDSQRTGNEGIKLESADVGPYISRTKQMQMMFNMADQKRQGKPRSRFDPDRPFEFRSGEVTIKGRTLGGTSVSFPHWLPMILLGTAPLVAMWRGFRRFQRKETYRCLHCGYDLTGNVSGVCPECGSAIPGGSSKDG